MSLLPIIFGDSLFDSMRPSRILDQHFGVPLHPEDLFSPLTVPREMRMMLHHPGYYRPWRTQAAGADTGSTVSLSKDKFAINLDVQQFKPEEITVKLTGKNQITIEAKHEEKEDEHGYISRHFVRRYVLPEGHDVEKLQSKLSSDGVLTIEAPKMDKMDVEHKEIKITQTGQPALEKKKEEKEQ